MKIKYYLLISLAINIVLLYVIFKPSPKESILEKALIDRIKKEHIIHINRIFVDSIRHEESIKLKNKKINTINYLRKNERNLYQLELSKIQLLTSDSSYFHVIDSIRKVCCTDSSR